MKNQLRKMDCALQRAKSKLMEKREGSDQLIVMFIIIAVAAGKTMYLKQQKEHGFYANKAAKQYKIDKESVYLAISSIQKKCRHKDGEPCKCKRTNKKCSPYSIECLYFRDFMNKLVTVSKANNINSVVKKEIQKPVKVKKERPEKEEKSKASY